MAESVQVDEILKALANPVRREILQWLKDPATHFEPQVCLPLQEGVCAKRIIEKAGLSQSTVSAYLAILQRAGLVKSVRRGAWTCYVRNEEAIHEFRACLERNL